MGVVNDPQAIKFCNERLRPLAEEFERLFAEMQSVKGWWDVYGATFFGGAVQGTDLVDDGRAAEGVAQLTAADVLSFMAHVGTTHAQYAAPYVMDVMRKPTVRPFRPTVGA
jgi:hypothetical protein